MKNLIELLKFPIFLYWSYMVVVVPTSIQLIGMHLFFNIKAQSSTSLAGLSCPIIPVSVHPA